MIIIIAIVNDCTAEPCHQVQLSFYKPLLLSSGWSKSMETFDQ